MSSSTQVIVLPHVAVRVRGLAWNKEKVPNGLKTVEDLGLSWPARWSSSPRCATPSRLIMLSQGVDISQPFTTEQFNAALDVLQQRVDSGPGQAGEGQLLQEDLINEQAAGAHRLVSDIFRSTPRMVTSGASLP